MWDEKHRAKESEAELGVGSGGVEGQRGATLDRNGVPAGEESSVRKDKRWEFLIALIGVLLMILQVLVALLALRISRITIVVKGEVQKVSARVERVENRMLQADFKITYPQDGATVDATDIVKGHTPYGDMNHYVVITPLQTGDDWVQDSPVKVFSGGTWTVRARFGTAGALPGEQFVARLLATQATLAPGPLLEVPKDAVFTESVIVTRKP